MNAHVQALRTQAETLAIQLNRQFQPMDFDQYFQSMYNYAMTLDRQSQERARVQRLAHQQNQNRTTAGGRGNGARGRGNDSGRGRGGQRGRGDGRGRGNASGNSYSDYVPPDKWSKMSSEEKRAHLEKRNKSGNSNASQPPGSINVNNQNVDASSVLTGPTQPAPAPAPAPAATPGTTLRNMMANASQRSQATAPVDQITLNGANYQRVGNVHKVSYRVTNQDVAVTTSGALVDGGANGGMAGDDARILEETFNTADVSGLGEHKLENLKVCNVAAVITTTSGPVIGFFNQYAVYGKGRTVHSIPQMAAYGLIVDDRSR
jgi:hypothetical protein